MHDVNIQRRVQDFIKIVNDQVGPSPNVLVDWLYLLHFAMFPS